MRKAVVMSIIFMMVIMCSCSAQESKLNKIPYIEIDNKRIYLQYSTKADVEKILGHSEEQEYLKTGLEDFNWSDFYVCYYDNKNLSFHYNNKEQVIRITVNSNYAKSSKIPIGLLVDVTSDSIKTELQKSKDQSAVISDDFISYIEKDLEQNSIIYSYWLYETQKVKWFDVYYESPWKYCTKREIT